MSHTPDTLDVTKRSQDVAPLRGERTIGQLVADASRDMSDLVRHEIALAKSEVKKEAVTAGAGIGMLVGAGVFGLVGFILLCFTAVYALIRFTSLPAWGSFGVVTLVLLILAGLLALIGKGRLSKLGAPERTIRTTKGTIDAVKGKH